MNSTVSFTVAELLLSCVWIALIVLLGYAIAILFRFYRMSKKVEGILTRHQNDVDLVMKELPQITKNIQEITTEAAHLTQAFRGTVDNVAETTESITGTIKDNGPVNESLASIYKTLATVKGITDQLGHILKKQ
jgi:methyl-accepting chemotaxis protein